jgi:hypothetical protein
VLKAAGADAVGSPFVFLDLLKCQPEGVREFRLAHFEHAPPHSQAAADMLVDRIWSVHRHRSASHCISVGRVRWETMRPSRASLETEDA